MDQDSRLSEVTTLSDLITMAPINPSQILILWTSVTVCVSLLRIISDSLIFVQVMEPTWLYDLLLVHYIKLTLDRVLLALTRTTTTLSIYPVSPTKHLFLPTEFSDAMALFPMIVRDRTSSSFLLLPFLQSLLKPCFELSRMVTIFLPSPSADRAAGPRARQLWSPAESLPLEKL